MTNNTLNFAQRTAILDKLKEVCTKGEDGMATYAKGWTDQVVAQAVGPSVNKANVMSIRKGQFGFVKAKRPPEPSPDDRIAALEARVAKLEERLC